MEYQASFGGETSQAVEEQNRRAFAQHFRRFKKKGQIAQRIII
jgi:hypothetical protein